MYQFILNIISQGVVLVKKIIIAKNLAYILMKPISKVKFKYSLNLIGFCITWKVVGGGDQRGVQVFYVGSI
jgi:hypothetical protein